MATTGDIKAMIFADFETIARLDSQFKTYEQSQKDLAWKENMDQMKKKISRLQLSSEDLNTLLSDFDNRVGLYVLSGLALSVRRMNDVDVRSILQIAAGHPARGVREAARLYLFGASYLSPSQVVARAWDITARRDISGTHYSSWTEYRLRAILHSSLSTDTRYEEESMFAGKNNRWMVQSAFPIMALLFRGGIVEWKDLLCVDLHSTALSEDVKHLMTIGEVLRFEEKQGLFKPPKTLFKLMRPEHWGGPPF